VFEVVVYEAWKEVGIREVVMRLWNFKPKVTPLPENMSNGEG